MNEVEYQRRVDRDADREHAIDALTNEIQNEIDIAMDGLSSAGWIAEAAKESVALAIEEFDDNCDELSNLKLAVAGGKYVKGLQHEVDALRHRLKAEAYQIASRKAEAIIDAPKEY